MTSRAGRFTYIHVTFHSRLLYVLCLRGGRHSAVWSANSYISTPLHVPRQRTVRPTHCMSGPPPDRAPRLLDAHINASQPATSTTQSDTSQFCIFAAVHHGSGLRPMPLRGPLAAQPLARPAVDTCEFCSSKYSHLCTSKIQYLTSSHTNREYTAG
jgi:hypothetical protein